MILNDRELNENWIELILIAEMTMIIIICSLLEISMICSIVLF